MKFVRRSGLCSPVSDCCKLTAGASHSPYPAKCILCVGADAFIRPRTGESTYPYTMAFLFERIKYRTVQSKPTNCRRAVATDGMVKTIPYKYNFPIERVEERLSAK